MRLCHGLEALNPSLRAHQSSGCQHKNNTPHNDHHKPNAPIHSTPHPLTIIPPILEKSGSVGPNFTPLCGLCGFAPRKGDWKDVRGEGQPGSSSPQYFFWAPVFTPPPPGWFFFPLEKDYFTTGFFLGREGGWRRRRGRARVGVSLRFQIELGASKIHGKGVFARKRFVVSEVVEVRPPHAFLSTPPNNRVGPFDRAVEPRELLSALENIPSTEIPHYFSDG